MSAQNYAKFRTEVSRGSEPRPTADTHILVDVREKVQFDLCNLEGSINIPFSTVSRAQIARPDDDANMEGLEPEWVSRLKTQSEKPIFVVCRLGNDSQITVKKMKTFGLDNGGQRWIGDIKGGLRAWRANVDSDFPDY
jgi:adenylyltransferase/sulfurtransferase